MERTKLKRSAQRRQMTKLTTKAETIVTKSEITPEDMTLLTCTIEGIKQELALQHTFDD